jgi:hypothetical protein
MTTLQLLNKVLRGLRQFDILIASGDTSTTDDYILMILQFLNEAKEEIEEAGWPWQALRTTMTVTLASGTSDYTLTSAGDADVDTTDRTRLLYENVNTGSESFYNGHSSQPQVFDVTTSSENRLNEVTIEKMERWHLTDDDETGQPTDFAIYAAAGNLKMKVYPTPAQAYTLKVRIYNPQAELTSTDITTVLSIPSRPVWTKALFKANEERGSELGKPGSSLWVTYQDAHGAATAGEMTPADETVYLDR